jgi:cytochrome d ubiquinol oxidase subunit I
MNLILARWQFAIVTIFHFFNVPLTLGLSILLAILETQYVRTGDEKFKRMVKFWGKVFLVNFAMGIVTGIVQEFQFGMNWSEYSRFMGDIFGTPLAIEALLAFYMESTFVGLWIFGWDKLSPKMHAAALWLVAIGSNISALWILAANSFMQNPVGYALDPETGRALMADFFALIKNPNLWYQFPHVLTAGMTTAGFVVLAFSSWHLLKGTKDKDFFQTSFRWAAVYALVGILSVATIGHFQGQFLVRHQPLKMAAAESLWETEQPASFSVVPGVNIPGVLSFLSYNNFTQEVKGINDLNAEMVAKFGEGDYVPPVWLNYWAFRTMVYVGSWLGLLALLAVYFMKNNAFEKYPWLLKSMVFSGFLPFLVNSAGWVMAETGRFPWIVYGLLKVENAVSPNVPAGSVAFSLIALTILYTAVTGVTLHLILKFGKSEPDAVAQQAY